MQDLELLKQHAQGYYNHNSKDITVKDITHWATLQEFIEWLETQNTTLDDRITALEEWGGGGPSTWGFSLGTHFKDRYIKCIIRNDELLTYHYVEPIRNEYLLVRYFYNENFNMMWWWLSASNCLVGWWLVTPLLTF